MCCSPRVLIREPSHAITVETSGKGAPRSAPPGPAPAAAAGGTTGPARTHGGSWQLGRRRTPRSPKQGARHKTNTRQTQPPSSHGKEQAAGHNARDELPSSLRLPRPGRSIGKTIRLTCEVGGDWVVLLQGNTGHSPGRIQQPWPVLLRG